MTGATSWKATSLNDVISGLYTIEASVLIRPLSQILFLTNKGSLKCLDLLGILLYYGLLTTAFLMNNGLIEGGGLPLLIVVYSGGVFTIVFTVLRIILI